MTKWLCLCSLIAALVAGCTNDAINVGGLDLASVDERILFIDDLPANLQAAEALGWHGEHCATPDGLHQRVWSRLQSQFGL